MNVGKGNAFGQLRVTGAIRERTIPLWKCARRETKG